MMNLSPSPSRINGAEFYAASRTIADVVAYIDTIELFFRFRVKGALRQLRRAGSPVAWFENCVDGLGMIRGHRLIVQLPTISAIKILDQMYSDYGAVLCRTDLAYDASARPGISNETVRRLFECQALLKWRPRGPMHQDHETVYWVKQKSRKSRSSRDLGLYPRPSKITGELGISHFELKLLNASTIKKQNIERPRDLLAINPRKLFRKHIRLVNYTPEQSDRIMREYVRSAVKAERMKHRKRSTRNGDEFLDRYRATIPRRLVGLWKRTGLYRVQTLANLFPRSVMRMKTMPDDTITLPDVLTWGAKPVLIDNKGKFQSDVSGCRVVMEKGHITDPIKTRTSSKTRCREVTRSHRKRSRDGED
jgi:hypothetical protein